MMKRFAFACLALLAWSFISHCPVGASVIGKSAQGTPALQTIDVIEFADNETLLLGDGRGAQVVAVVARESSDRSAPPSKIENIKAKLGQRIGTAPDGIEIIDLAVHPKSGRVFFAVRKQDDKTYAVLTLDPAGKIGEFPLTDVTYASVSLAVGKSPISKLTDIAWADDRLVAAAATSEEFASKIFVVRGLINHQTQGELHSAETYHVAHRKWETKAPMSVIMPYREEGKTYVVGAFACTPVVKYELDSLAPDANVKGQSMIELGSGNRPLDMFTYGKDGREYVLANTFRFHHERKPFGPSPYWTVRFERSLLGQNDKINEQATLRLAGNYEPATDRIVVVESFHGVMQMDKLGEDRAAVLRAGPEGRVDFEVLTLP